DSRIVTWPRSISPASTISGVADFTAAAVSCITSPIAPLNRHGSDVLNRRSRTAGGGLLADGFRLVVARHLGGQVDRTRQVGTALHCAGLPGHRVLECRRLEDSVSRISTARRLGDGPVDRKTNVVVAGRNGKQLEVGVGFLVVSPEATQGVTVRCRKRR